MPASCFCCVDFAWWGGAVFFVSCFWFVLALHDEVVPAVCYYVCVGVAWWGGARFCWFGSASYAGVMPMVWLSCANAHAHTSTHIYYVPGPCAHICWFVMLAPVIVRCAGSFEMCRQSVVVCRVWGACEFVCLCCRGGVRRMWGFLNGFRRGFGFWKGQLEAGIVDFGAVWCVWPACLIIFVFCLYECISNVYRIYKFSGNHCANSSIRNTKPASRCSASPSLSLVCVVVAGKCRI